MSRLLSVDSGLAGIVFLKGDFKVKKIVDDSVIDVVPFSYGFVYAKKENDDNGNVRAAFYCFNAKTGKVEAVRCSAYQQTKFGENYEKICNVVKNFIFCDCAKLCENDEYVVLLPDSKMMYFDNEGKEIWGENLCYRDSPVKSLTSDEDCIWTVVPEKNSIVRFSPSTRKVYIRIGGNETTSFNDPVGVTKIGNQLFVCCAEPKKIRKIDLQSYSIKDYKVFNEPVYKYYRLFGKEYVLLRSGLYVL